MSEFLLRVETDLTPTRAWERIWDLGRQSAVIPLTDVRLDQSATLLEEGAVFSGRTSLGPFGFDDPMRVTTWSPPTTTEGGVATVVKTGPVVGGRIEVRVGPLGHGAVVQWRQGLALPWLPRRLRWLEATAAWLAAPGYRWALRRLLT